MKNQRKFLISVPYIYPVCPLSIDHAKIMLVADINARSARLEGKEVCFPIAAHYSGVTAEKSIEKLESNDTFIRNKERDKFIKVYKTPRIIVESFKTPESILDYYTAQTLIDLKRLGISCDFNNFYKTNEKEYEIFINAIFKKYEEKEVLIKNSKDELALNYNDLEWRKKTKKYVDKLNVIHPNLKINIVSSFENIKSDWGILRNYGMGVKYKEFIIDPMFDSELFVIYDLYKKFSWIYKGKDYEKVFDELFECLEKINAASKYKIVNEILNWLPTDLFVCEEHLKNWIIKKSFSESLLFNKKYVTKNYFITGMGYINGQRMSSSRGTAVLLKDLLDNYDSNVTRLIIMFTGGHPSKMYNYTEQNIDVINKMLSDFYNHINYINAVTIDCVNNKEFSSEFSELKKLLDSGFYQQLIVEVLKNIPKKCYNLSKDEILRKKNTIKYFLDILLPEINL